LSLCNAWHEGQKGNKAKPSHVENLSVISPLAAGGRHAFESELVTSAHKIRSLLVRPVGTHISPADAPRSRELRAGERGPYP
jgi:hypothetical protein